MITDLNSEAFDYAPRIINRAKRALSCSPFCLKLFKEMRNQSVPIQQIAGETGIKLGYATQAFSEPKTEAKLVWLISVGLLRREVDGQGLTDSFRLTPLGRKIVTQWEQEQNQIPPASLIDPVFNWLNRWLK
ncbi:Npun_F0494 family protein [Pleurocapsa sp. FMAR1]|uniref:Npun_F0494 family protein n=1 Tax=Pleurocapsa sp. FMAR1 TaxID=3040204 RepID=UPI0029C9AC52|nr:Npun_F0494 family protein [Pleurocapsa sp. FMAR1]